ncbi:MAG TPA: helix-turn-helix domain-containing protein [Solirubrobacteraceae bacterium]|jgi:AcrR family transcriptional regulator|nr:helix-turn-helix domain-containing protein [Solirubrobacteraceae bacterium]
MGRDEAILRAAAELFLERGFGGVTVDEIGARAGVSGPAVYHHFASKDEILATLFDQAMDDLLLLVDTPAGDDPHEVLESLVVAQAAFALTDLVLVSVYAREARSLAEPWRRQASRRQRQHVDRWLDAMRACYPQREESELLSAAHAVIGLSLSVATWEQAALQTPGLQELLAELMRGALDRLNAP